MENKCTSENGRHNWRGPPNTCKTCGYFSYAGRDRSRVMWNAGYELAYSRPRYHQRNYYRRRDGE